MGDMGEMFREHREYMRGRKEKLGVDCPGCIKEQPKRIPTRLLPEQKCKVCGYRDPRSKNHNKDCELGDNWKECPACVEQHNNTCKSGEELP